MKKLFLLICITLCATAAFAQLPYFNYGLKSGFNVSRLYFTDKSVPMKPAHCTGYLLGMWGRAGGYTFFLQPEAYLQRRNGKYYASIATQPDRTPGTAEEEYNDGSVKNNMTAFEMTMLLGTTVETGKVRTRLMAGPVIPIRLYNELVISYQGIERDAYIKNIVLYKDTAMGLQGGVGVDFHRLGFDLRYEQGFGNWWAADGPGRQRQNLWQFSLSYELR